MSDPDLNHDEHTNVNLATEEEIDKLLKFIGGFKYWPLLNEDCRMEVVKYLDYKERFKLGICSKSDYATVERTPIHVHYVRICENEKPLNSPRNDPMDNVIVKVIFGYDYNPESCLQLFFFNHGQDTRIQWEQYLSDNQVSGPKQIIRKSCNYYEEGVKYAEKWMKKCNYELKSIRVGMSKYPFESSQIKKLPECKSVIIEANDVESFEWWLEKVPEQLDGLLLNTHFELQPTLSLPSKLLGTPQVMRVPNLYCWCRSAFNDEQFLNFKAKSITLLCFGITDNGINEYIKKWANGKGVPDLEEISLWIYEERNQEDILKGLDARKWDGDFEEEEPEFCSEFESRHGRANTFQINNRVDPFESITLDISSGKFSIHATGKRCEENGRTFTKYMI